MKSISVYIIDDHEMFREGVKTLLQNSDKLQVIGEASNGEQCLDEIPPHTDIALMDISMPKMNGIETTQKLVLKHPNIKIIALSMFGDEEYYYKMIHAGVKGFVLKESGSKELEEAISEVFEGRSFFSQELLRNIIVSLGDKNAVNNEKENTKMVFTKRETELLQEICKGLSNKEIADSLDISLRTVESHKSKLLQKTDSKNTISLVLYAIKNNLISIN